MRQLTLSLLIVVVTSVIGLGWLISEIYYRIESSDDKPSNELNLYQQLGAELAYALGRIEDKEAFVEHWGKASLNPSSTHQNRLHISLQDITQFPVPDELLPQFNLGTPLTLESDGDVSIHYRLDNTEQVLTLLLPASALASKPSTLNLILTLTFYFGVIIIILIWLYPLIRSLVVLQKAAIAFGQGDLSSRVKKGRISYIIEIENEFNRMADRIQTLIDDNKLLSRAVSHDLKTPLARLRFGIDTLEETENSQAREKYTRRINKDLLEMESLVETLLQYARLDEANVQFKPQDINLSSFALQVLEASYEPNISIDFDCPTQTTNIRADKRYLAMQLNNIMSNALHYATSKVLVRVYQEGSGIVIAIEDDGAGIPEKDRDDIIKPFVRGSNTDGQKGHGMGLAIVARIAQWTKATLAIDTAKELGGASVRLHFNHTEE